MQGRAGCLAGGGGFRAGELRRLFGAEDPTLDLVLVEGWSGSGAQGRRICQPSACATVVEPSQTECPHAWSPWPFLSGSITPSSKERSAPEILSILSFSSPGLTPTFTYKLRCKMPLRGALQGHCKIPQAGRLSCLLYSLHYGDFTCNIRFLKRRLQTLCFQENVNRFCRVLELPAAAQGAQQPFCALAVVDETPGPETPRTEETRHAAEKEGEKSSSQLGPHPRRKEKSAFLSTGHHSALASICQAAAGTLRQSPRLRSWRCAVFGGRGGRMPFSGRGGKGSQNAGQGDAWQGAEAFGLGSSGGCLGQRTQHWT